MARKKIYVKPSNYIMPIAALLVAVFGLAMIVTGVLYKTVLKSEFCANSESCIKDLSGLYDPTRAGVYMGRNVMAPAADTQAPLLARTTLGVATDQGSKHIYVNLTEQKLYAMEGDTVIYTFPISSGKWALTPTGDFNIWIKLRYTRMSGGNPAIGTYYNLPNVPFTMYFYNAEHPKTEGYGLHGAYWHENFGHPMSHGCVNLDEPDAEALFNWADPVSSKYVTYASDDAPGTPITIYGETPVE